MLERGTLRIGSYRGAPLLLHWSLGLGLLAFGGFRIAPGFWLGFTLLILAHELGHAYLVRRMGFGVQAVVVHGFGGYCRWSGQASRLEHAVIAWGGVLAQAIVLLLTLLYVASAGPPTSLFGAELQGAWVQTNLMIMALNLLPIAPLDGAEAWQIFRAMRVESVTFGEVVRRCLPFSWRRRSPPPPGMKEQKAQRAATEMRNQPPRGTTGRAEGKPSKEAQEAIAEALEKISKQAKEARSKKPN